MIHHSNQLIIYTVDNLKLFQFHLQINLLHSNQVSISGVLVIETFQMNY